MQAGISFLNSNSRHLQGKLFFASAFGGSDLPLGSEQGALFSPVMFLGAISFLLKIETHIYISGFFLSSEQKTLENGFDFEVSCIVQRTAGSKQLIESCGVHSSAPAVFLHDAGLCHADLVSACHALPLRILLVAS